MVKGVKKIKWTGKGRVISSMSKPDKKVVIIPNQIVSFEVDQWYKNTSEEDKKKTLTWILQDRKKQTIILQRNLAANHPFEINIPAELCGPFQYYLEASLGNKRDLLNETGLYISGNCPAKMVSSKWSIKMGGEDIRKTHIFSYGEPAFLNLKVEGLNGHKSLKIEIFRHLNFKTDPLIFKYTDVEVIDGEINVEIKSTFSWYSVIKGIKETEEFYIKIYDPVTKTYIVDNKNLQDHATFLRINKKIVSTQIKPPTNLSPLKTGDPGKNKERYELCKFETISITEKKATTLLFNNGKNLSNVTNPKTPVLKTILFDFEKHDITPEAKTILNNVLQYLLGSQHSTIKIDGHACVIGKELYNQKLSQQRSDAVKKVFVDGGLDASRIVSIGRGEVNATDDKNGKDNIKHKNEKEYIENRRVDITFDSYGHDAQTITFETIAKSTNQDFTIDITEYQNKACFKDVKHKKNIKINSAEYPKAIDKVADKLEFPVKANLSQFNVFPIKYIWPKVFANQYDIHVHSCRYFSNDSNPTIRVMAYPDIKWDFHFFLNLSNELSVKWKDLPPGKDTEMRKKAGKIGAEKRWKQTDIDFGVVLEANWDKIDDDKYDHHFDVTLKYEAKIKQLYSVFSSLKEFSKGVTGSTKGIAKKSNLPFDVQMKPPNFCLGAIWQLARGSKKNISSNELGIEYTMYFKAEPLIALVLTIDLLDLAVQSAGTIVGGPAGNLAAQAILDLIKKWAARDSDLGITFKILFDLILTGQIDGSADLTINTAADNNKAKAELKTKLSAEIKLEVELKAKAVVLEVTAYAAGIAKASGKASITFGHSLNYIQATNNLYYKPQMNFDGVTAKVLIKIEAGLSAKKLNLDFNRNKVIVDEEFKFWGEFDIIKQLEKTTGYDANINLI
jgi:outer membrane protein OmpA-like peptidoglycan-associated protein